MSVEQHKSIRQQVDRHLTMRLRMFCVIFPVKLGLIVIEVVNDQIEIGIVLEGIVIGLIIGLIISRIYHLNWDEQNSRVVSQINWIGGIILTLYAILMICRYWVEASTLATFGLCISAGFMPGRLIGVRRDILKTLQAFEISKSISKKKINEGN